MTRVLIVEDYAPLLRMYRLLLAADPEMLCVGQAARGREAIDLVHRLVPDVLVLDISLPDVNGLDVARRIRATCPPTHIVILGEMDWVEYHAAAASSGASAYLCKGQTVHNLVPLVRRLAIEMRDRAIDSEAKSA